MVITFFFCQNVRQVHFVKHWRGEKYFDAHYVITLNNFTAIVLYYTSILYLLSTRTIKLIFMSIK